MTVKDVAAKVWDVFWGSFWVIIAVGVSLFVVWYFWSVIRTFLWMAQEFEDIPH